MPEDRARSAGPMSPSTIALTTAPNAAPMTTPTASSIALPREMKSLKPWNTFAVPCRPLARSAQAGADPVGHGAPRAGVGGRRRRRGCALPERSIMARRPRTARRRPRRRRGPAPRRATPPASTGTESSPDAAAAEQPGRAHASAGRRAGRARAARHDVARPALGGRRQDVDVHAGGEQPGDRGVGEPDGRDDGAGRAADLVGRRAGPVRAGCRC